MGGRPGKYALFGECGHQPAYKNLAVERLRTAPSRVVAPAPLYPTGDMYRSGGQARCLNRNGDVPTYNVLHRGLERIDSGGHLLH